MGVLSFLGSIYMRLMILTKFMSTIKGLMKHLKEMKSCYLEYNRAD